MKKIITLCAFLLTSSSLPALALIPPLKLQELEERSDLIVDGESLSLACDGPLQRRPDSCDVPFVAVFRVDRVEKDIKNDSVAVGSTIAVRSMNVEMKPGYAGGGTSARPVGGGWKGKLYLTKVGAGYQATHWNGLVEASDSRETSWPEIGRAHV